MIKRFFNGLLALVEDLLMQKESENGHPTYQDKCFAIFEYARSESEKLEGYLLDEVDESKWESVIIGTIGGIREMFEAQQFVWLLDNEPLDNLYWTGLGSCHREIKRLAGKYGLITLGSDLGSDKGRIVDSLNDSVIYILNLYRGDSKKEDETAGEGHNRPQDAVKPSFRSIIQHPDKDGLLKRLHELIDEETSPAMVGAILLRASAAFESLIKRMPTQQEFDEEFPLFKYNNWQAIHNYTNLNNPNALGKANKIVIFVKK